MNLLAAWHLGRASSRGTPANPPLPPGGSHRNAIPLYDFPNQRVSNHLVMQSPLRASALRALGGHANVFAIESFMDELALAAGRGPGRIPPAPPQGCSRAGGNRDGRAKIRLEETDEPVTARAVAASDSRATRTWVAMSRSSPKSTCEAGARHARMGGSRRRAGDQSGRRDRTRSKAGSSRPRA